jgi:putative OPT family oligopeptide transporter
MAMATTTTAPAAADEAPAHKPYVPDEAHLKEFTPSAVILGTLLGLVFAASSLYLVLKVGMTVSASIPVAVLAITLFRGLSQAFGFRRATILENNIVQTAGSAGESIAFGVGVTMPALLLLGYTMDLPRIMVVSILGGILGILAMIPLRRAFIVKMHGRPGQPGTLLYPEGTACAQVLISGEKGGTTGKTVFVGFGIAFVHKFITEGMALLKETVTIPITFINKAAVFAQAMASELLGVGYIIGLRTSAMMMAGAVLGYLVIIPIIYFIGEYAPGAIPPGDRPIKEMSISQIRNNYLLFIGAGTVATAGILSMFKTLPMIVRGVVGGLRGVGGAKGNGPRRRTENDMPMSVVLLGSLGLLVLLALFLMVEVGVVAAIAGAVLVLVFGFLFVTVSARLTGEIGSSSNPISGMTTATLMLTCLIFLALGWQSSTDRLLALSIAAVVCIASSNGGTTAQSLKTGFLVGGTPKLMQYAILIGALVSALVIGATLIAFNESRAVVSTKPENVPNFTLTKPELNRLKEIVVYEGKTYKVWHTKNDDLLVADPKTGYTPRPEVVKFGERRAIYYVDPDSGKLAALKDNTIMGQLEERDDGSYVKREFEAPKTQVMGIVINGVLRGDLNWSMIGIGAMIALMLELCGVSALAFAVGVYVPIQYSTPIFLGGIVRHFVDRYLAKQADAEAQANIQAAIAAAGEDPVARLRAEAEAKAQAEIDAIRKSETSGGVLLASGYIAGGSLAGVLLGFLAFSDDLPDDLRAFEHRTVKIVAPEPLSRAAEEVARNQLGLPRPAPLPANASPAEKERAQKNEERVKQLAKEIADLSSNEPYLWVQVPKGTTLKLPEGKGDFVAPSDMTLREVAAEQLGRERKARKIFDRNADKLMVPAALPAGAELRLPAQDWPAWIAFLALAAFLLAVGVGWLLRPPPEEGPVSNNGEAAYVT